MAAVPTAVRVLIQFAKWSSLNHLTWINVSQLEEGGPVVAMWTGNYTLMKMSAKYSRALASTPTQDAAITTHHFLNLTAGAPDASWIAGDFTVVENAFSTFWASIGASYLPSVLLTELSWRKDGPAYRPHTPKPDGLLSPVVRATAKNAPGTASTGASGIQLPPQVAVSVTEVTAAKYTVEDVEGSGAQVRNRWGRFYLPAPIAGVMVNGRLATSVGDAWATACQTFYNACTSGGIVPVMYSPTTGNAWSVDEIHVDDILDVIRSRRYDTPLSRSARTITPAS